MTHFKPKIVPEMSRLSPVYAVDVLTDAKEIVICSGPPSGGESFFIRNLSVV